MSVTIHTQVLRRRIATLNSLAAASRRAISKFAGPVALVFLSVLSFSCVSAPHTGRTQFINPLITTEYEIALGAEAYTQALSQAKLSENAEYQRRVERVGFRIVEASETSGLEWEFKVIEDDSVINAWALPGGKIAVYTGLLRLTAGDDALLATVMAHEVAHVTQRHGAERMTTALGVDLVASGLDIALKNKDPETRNLVFGAYGLGSDLVVSKPFQRDMEEESDRVGLKFMALAGYDPEKAIEFWQKMGEAAGPEQIPELLSTHPSRGRRLDNLRRWMPEARTFFKPIQP